MTKDDYMRLIVGDGVEIATNPQKRLYLRKEWKRRGLKTEKIAKMRRKQLFTLSKKF